MSYILDALQRADAERERGTVPGLHTQPVIVPATATTRRARTGLGLALTAVLILGGAAAGRGWWRSAPVAPPPVAQALPAVPSTPAAMVAATPLAPPNAVPVAAAASIPTVVPVPAPVPARIASASALPLAAASAPKPVGLTEELRRQMAPLLITGSVYSDNPAQRMLVVNNQVLMQGSLAAPEVTLEEIGPRSSIFRFRGTRFQMPH